LKIAGLKREVQRITKTEPSTIHFSEVKGVDAGVFDRVILSGGEAPLNRPEVAALYSETLSWISKVEVPMLGICFGHQLIGLAFGGRVVRMARRFDGYRTVEVVEREGIFKDLPERIKVYESHIRVVAKVMPEFKLLAKGVDYEVEAFRHNYRPIYGVQFHPERYTVKYPHGRRVLENFINSP